MCARTWMDRLNRTAPAVIAVLAVIMIFALRMGVQHASHVYVVQTTAQTKEITAALNQATRKQVAATARVTAALDDQAQQLATDLEKLTLATNDVRTDSAASTPALAGLLAKGATVHSHFVVGNQLTAWDISFGGKRDIYYTTADGQYLLLGAVLDAAGKNVSAQHQAGIPGGGGTAPAVATGVSQQILKSVYAQMEAGDTITFGQGEPELYVIFEPNCPFCARLDRKLVNVDSDVTIHYVPVAFLSPLSPTVAAILLDSANPRPLLDDLEKIAWYEADMTPFIDKHKPKHALPDVSGLLRRNADLMRQAGISGTPAIFYRDSDGNVQLHKGVPRPAALDHIMAAIGATTDSKES